MKMHWNLGTWAGVPNIPPKVQVIFWREWKGVRWHRWTGGIGAILRGSLVLGFVELRVWRRPTLHTVATTDRLLAQILIELMQLRGRRDTVELSERLRGIGFSTAQCAALLGTTPATLHVLTGRKAKTMPSPVPEPPNGEAPESSPRVKGISSSGIS